MSAMAAYPTHAEVSVVTLGCRGALAVSCASAGATARNAMLAAEIIRAGFIDQDFTSWHFMCFSGTRAIALRVSTTNLACCPSKE